MINKNTTYQPLSRQSYWNSINLPAKSFFGKFSLWLGKIPLINHFADHYLWHKIAPGQLPYNDQFKVIEIGSAPGNNLISIHEIFGYEPYGVEYTESGVTTNKIKFSRNNLNPENVIYADFFSDDFQKTYAEYFDVVMSFGFIEHFEDPDIAISKHLNLLKTNGYLVVTIPNLKGLNYKLIKYFNPELLKIHNLNIMDLSSYKKLFNTDIVKPLICSYYGIFSFNMCESDFLFKLILTKILKVIQLPINLCLNLFAGKYHPEKQSPYFSPYLIFIGQKK